MSIRFVCQCGKTLKAAEELAGKRAKCNRCGKPVTIPAVGEEVGQAASVTVASTATAVKKSPRPPKAKNASSRARKTVASPTPIAVCPIGFDDFLAAELPAIEPAATFPEDARLCPGCQNPLPAVAVLCVQCGYDLNTGKKTVTFYYPSVEKVETLQTTASPRVNPMLVFLGALVGKRKAERK